MKIFLTLATAVVVAAPLAGAFDFKVRDIQAVDVNGAPEAYHPVFSNDGKSLFVTSEGYDGLGIVNLADHSYRLLSNRPGAGYRFAQDTDGGRVLVRENDFMTQKLALYVVDVASASEHCVAPVVEHTNALTMQQGVIAYAEPLQQKIKTHVDPEVLRPMSATKMAAAPMLTEEDLKLVLYTDGKRTVIDPILDTTGKDVNYCWSSLSPDGSRMLFVAGNDAYTCRLDGSELVGLGAIHAPVWRDNDVVIGMLDSDDGHFFTASDIVAADIRSAERMQLTPSTDEIKMFPSVSPDGNRIAFHTTAGKLYIINLESTK